MIRLVNLDHNCSEAKKQIPKSKKVTKHTKGANISTITNLEEDIIIPIVIGKERIAGLFTVTEYTGGENDQSPEEFSFNPFNHNRRIEF